MICFFAASFLPVFEEAGEEEEEASSQVFAAFWIFSLEPLSREGYATEGGGEMQEHPHPKKTWSICK